MRLALAELAIIGACILAIVVVAVVAVVLVLALSRTQRSYASRMAALEGENRRLREDLDSMKKE